MSGPIPAAAPSEEAAETVERDISWRWQVGGVGALNPGQRRDAEAAFDAWLRRYGRYELNGVQVDELKDFVRAIQEASHRTCGLEAFRPAVETGRGNGGEKARAALEAAMRRLAVAQRGFLSAYRAFDGHFEGIKADAALFAPLDRSRASLDLDHAAWSLSRSAMVASAAAAAAGCRLSGSPLRHPFLCARTERYIRTVMLDRADEAEKPPPMPHEGDPRALDGVGQAAVMAWLSEHGEQDDAWRRAQEAASVGIETRAEMMRWLEGVGRLEAVAIDAERDGGMLSITGKGLTKAKRADLRRLRTEMNGFRSLKVDVAAQAEVVRGAEAGGDADLAAAERKALERLEEMRDHHKARATFFWVRSFHFEPEAQAEAEWLAPRLIAVVRKEIAPDVTEQSGQVSAALAEQPPEVRAAIGELADAAHAASETDVAETAKGKRASSAGAMAARIAAAMRAVGSRAMSRIKGVLPALARQAMGMANAERSPLERLADELRDWRLTGLATADKRMRRAPDAASRMSARHTLIGYARAVTGDPRLLLRVRAADPAVTAWIERMAMTEERGGAPKVQPPEPLVADVVAETTAPGFIR